ncbi:MAG: hypothetical protein K2J06_07525, partial [Muribaculaceae bacterium]|nr:hypothetical protein [Muribaculaceae bacterium]
VLLALTHYMGSDYEAYSAMPEAVRRLKTPDRIPIDIAEALLRVNYPFIPSGDDNVLQHMLYEGAIASALASIFPDRDADFILGVPSGHFENISRSMPELWSLASSTGLLYSSDDKTKTQLFSRMTGLDYPAYFGPAAGWMILRSYMTNNPATSLNTILSPDFYQQAQGRLIEAKYLPK